MTSNTTQAVVFRETGDSSVLSIEALDLSPPAAGEVQIRVEAIGLNRAEIMFREGAYLEQPVFPARMGYEAAGVVTALGDGVSGFELGQRVSTIPAFSMGVHGVYAHMANVPAHAVSAYPDRLSPREGASIWMQYVTAWGGLIARGGLASGKTVIITAASSSVGLASIQLARAEGATVIATTRGGSKVEALKTAGAHHVIQTDTENLVERVQEITQGQGADIAFDPVAGPIVDELAQAMGARGRIILYGLLDTRPVNVPLFPMLAKGVSLIGYTLFEITQDPEALEAAKAYLYSRLDDGAITPILDKDFAFEDIAKAQDYMASNQQIGKITVSV